LIIYKAKEAHLIRMSSVHLRNGMSLYQHAGRKRGFMAGRYRKSVSMILSLALLMTVSACGNTPGQRALSGGAIGAGAGTVGAVLLDTNPVAGAVIGAAAGAVTGAVTSKKQIDLGDIK
jgi:hypothetical protein